jgi:hypothetical protein
MSDSDRLLVSSGLRDVTSGEFAGSEIWSFDDMGGQQLVIRTGDTAPGLPGLMVGSGVGLTAHGDDGAHVIRGILDGTDVDSTNDSVLWIDRNTGNGLEVLYREGQTVSESPEPLGNLRLATLSRSGHVLFQSNSETNGEVVTRLMLHNPDTGLVEVARTGQQVPGFGNNVVFTDFDRNIVNALGQVAFNATVSGLGVDDFSNDGLWIWNGSSLELVAAEGRMADFDPDPAVQDLKTIGGPGIGWLSITSYGGFNQQSTGFNDRGQLIYNLRASGGDAAFILTVAVLGDVNLDGVVDFQDISPFIGLLINGTYQVEADTNEDGVVDFQDIAHFVDLLVG